MRNAREPRISTAPDTTTNVQSYRHSPSHSRSQPHGDRDRGPAVPGAADFLRLVRKLAADAERQAQRREEEARERSRLRGRLINRADALYIISIAAELAEMHPQTLRKYDREGLVQPSRSQGSRRMYSEDDLERLQIVRRLTEDLGLNLSGVSLILDLVTKLKGMLQVLESMPDAERSYSVRAVTDQLKLLIWFLGVEE